MGKFLTGFFIGITAGAVVALMYAPQEGKKTRRQVRRNIDDYSEKIRDTAENVSDQAQKSYKKTRETVSDILDSAQDAVAAAKKAANFS